MDDQQLDVRIRNAVRPLVTDIVGRDAVAAGDVVHAGWRLPRALVQLSLVAVAAALFVSMLFIRMSGQTGGPPSDSGQVVLGSWLVGAHVTDSRLELTLANGDGQEGRTVAAVPITTEKLMVRQAVCPPSSLLYRHVVLFGRIDGGYDPSLAVDGLGGGSLGQSPDGAFVFVGDDVRTGTTWKVTAGNLGSVSGHVGVWGTRDSGKSDDVCVIADPNNEVKP